MNNINSAELLMDRFKRSGRGIRAYAVAKGLQETALRRVLVGITNGRNARKEGQTRKVICHLKEDGIWIGQLPWERAVEKEVA